MRRILKLTLALAVILAVFAFAACQGEEAPSPAVDPAPVVEVEPAAPGEVAEVEVVEGDPRLAQHGLEIGPDGNLRFINTVNITTQLWDRANERVPDFTESYWAHWIADQMLAVHNIQIEWIAVPRWTEGDHLTTLLGAGDAPDVAFTFSMPIVQTFAEMGAVLDLAPLLDAYRDWLPNMYGLLTPTNVYWNQEADTGIIWAMPGRLLADGRILTFVRGDWLDTLGIAEPTTLAEYEAMLIAFRDNAELLLGADAHNMVPLMVDNDVVWNVQALTENFLPNQMTEREWWVRGFDDRRFMHEDAKREALRVFNRWYNYGLLWDEFVYRTADDPMAADLIRLGFIGSYIGNWDMPYRAADGWTRYMQENVGPEARFVPIAPFPNESGQMVKYMPPPTDRSIFFPHTNSNPVASLLYLEFMSRLDTRTFLAFGIEGVHHIRHADGAIETLPFDDVPDHQHIPSLRNFDISLMVNGVDMGDPILTGRTLSFAYPGTDPELIIRAREIGLSRARVFPQVQTRPRASEEGMSTPLADARNGVAHRSIVAPIDQFDAVWEAGWAEYMALGARAIIEERDAIWVEFFGDVDNRPGFPGW